MNMQPVLRPRSSANGFSHRRAEREGGMSKAHPVNSLPVKPPNTVVSGEAACLENPSRDRLVYLATCMIGHPVEVQLKNGSLYSGIFHAADVEKDFGIILKMACLIKEGTSRAQKSRSEFVSKPPSKTLIIPADELVQVVAHELSITRDGMSDALKCEKPSDLLTDSSISQSSRVDMGRELKPWVPDEDFPECPELEDVFDGPWNRGWDQFEVNKTLFGVKSTFNEELYTTKLERGPKTRELEEQAIRIAREIEGESTRDIHIAEERGLQLNETFDTDEETKYSSVHRVEEFDDSGLKDEEDILLDSCNNLTFGDTSASDGNKSASSGGKANEEAWGGDLSTQRNLSTDQSCSISGKIVQEHVSEQPSKDLSAPDSNIRTEIQLSEQRSSSLEVADNDRQPSEESVSGLGDSQPSLNESEEDISKSGKAVGTVISDLLPPPKAGKPKPESTSGHPNSSASATSETGNAAPSASSRSGLSPSSSVGSLTSEKSTLNPNAKEFKLNPNAKSFKPSSQSATRPPSPVADGSFYYPPPVIPQMMPLVGYGMGQVFHGQQPIMYTPQLSPMQAPPQTTYFPPNAPQPQYPHQQHMMLGQQPRPTVVYMPPYQPQPEMPYGRGRDY
ncbi:PREDICTED: polyadenylate-binding protein-interacting protein 3-like isoform X4 [Tarenaya hassleriana]|uniref:polyadenylate-binding protein-interacting protein 3-like isoform X4 n=1 Tax=Tarenaya hassleriana TaxID=28532 RepID=UPI00053C1B37|nr:PREDICTED: polyadenylate-binding protein-interacting protein 3-like isoform X4 [Tarenaya hassleriana]